MPGEDARPRQAIAKQALTDSLRLREPCGVGARLRQLETVKRQNKARADSGTRPGGSYLRAQSTGASETQAM